MIKELLVWTDTPVKDESELVMLQSRLNTKQSACDKCEHNIYSQSSHQELIDDNILI
jgi:hypothetical protein